MMSKQIFDALTKNQQDAIMAIGLEMEAFGTKEAMADDQKVAEVYAKKGAKVFDLDEATVDKWRAIARDTAWKDYAARSAARGGADQARRRRARLLKRGHGGVDVARPRPCRDRTRWGVRHRTPPRIASSRRSTASS